MSSRTLMAACLALMIAAPAIYAQEKPTNGDSNSNSSDRNNRGRGGFDMNGFIDHIKERMGTTDDEWKVIQPKLQKVMDIRRESMSSMFGGSRRSRDGNSSDNSNKSAVEQASKELVNERFMLQDDADLFIESAKTDDLPLQ